MVHADWSQLRSARKDLQGIAFCKQGLDRAELLQERDRLQEMWR